jgi:hypothetical protein
MSYIDKYKISDNLYSLLVVQANYRLTGRVADKFLKAAN